MSKSNKMYLDVYNTHMELYPYVKGQYPIIEKMYTATDKFAGTEYPCGYMIENGKLFMPRGTPISKIEHLTGCKINYINDSDPYQDMKRKHYALYEPRNELQSESIDFLCNGGAQLALNLATGFGKGEPYTRKIPAPNKDGYILMGDLINGSIIYDENGNKTTVTGIFELGEQEIYKFTFEDGRTALCTDQHLWKIYYENNYIKIDTAKHLYHELSNNPWNMMYIQLCSPTNYEYHTPKIDPYIYGKILSNAIANQKFISFDMYNHSMYDIIKYMNWNYVYDYDNNRIIVIDKSNHKPILFNSFINTDIINDYLLNSTYVRTKFIEGINSTHYNTDSSGYYTIPFISKEINDAINQVYYSMGYSVKPINDANGDMVFFVNMDSMYLRITNIEIIPEKQKARCIRVSNLSHLYLTENYIVTHNTFCVAYSITKLNQKALIITPNEGLKQQWLNTFTKMFEYRPSELMNISGSNIMKGLLNDDIDSAELYFVNHQTLHNFLTINNSYMLQRFFKKLNIGVRVYDEAHMEFKNILMMDFFSNTNRTWYLTATFDRSDISESRCFKQAFSSVSAYGEIESKEAIKKHVIYHVVNINSRISPQNRAKVIGYRGLTTVSYGNYAFFDDPNQTMYKTIATIVHKCENLEGKILIFVPLVDAVKLVAKKLKEEFPTKHIGVYHSKISASERETAKENDIIVSTIKSCGTGRDIPGLRCVICAEQVASKVIAEQMVGRLRPYKDGLDTYFFDIVDRSINVLSYWHRARFKKIQTLVKEVIYLN